MDISRVMTKRVQAFLDIANDESYDAVWFARGGYGSCRVVEAIMCGLTESSKQKGYVGYSDAGMLLAALYRSGSYDWDSPTLGMTPATRLCLRGPTND